MKIALFGYGIDPSVRDLQHVEHLVAFLSDCIELVLVGGFQGVMEQAILSAQENRLAVNIIIEEERFCMLN